MRSYAPSAGEYDFEQFRAGIERDRRQKPGDFLIAERDGVVVGTTTSISLRMWLRGGCVPCQGVAFVGTIKTARRSGKPGEPGIASQLMHATLDKARERGEVISALMPFRASYYEHFGYGNAEHRTDWTVPLPILPRGDFPGIRFFRREDKPALLAARQRECANGHCDIETSPEALDLWIDHHWDTGMAVVDQPFPGGAINGWAFFTENRNGASATLDVPDWCAADAPTLLRLLSFFGSLKDQYSTVKITLPGDYPLNRVLRESQIPHRQVDHPVAAARPFTRMQVRVLDHQRVLEAMRLPMHARGRATIGVRECEGSVSTFAMDVSDGRIAVSRAGSVDVEMSDVLWASIVTGDLPASSAVKLGLLPGSTRSEVIDLLDAFSMGPAPFCQEYF